jgi:hypothetical protein
VLFGKGRFLDRDTEDWHFETWAWLKRNLRGDLAKTPLVLPNRDFFTPTKAQGHERALYAFERVKVVMGMSDWPCELVADDGPGGPQKVGDLLIVQGTGRPAGTFSAKEGVVTIVYAADLVQEPMQLVATFAHELSHYLLASVTEPPPGGWELHELATDLAVAYCGFGVFGANSAFQFERYQTSGGHGWKSRRSGYLSERTWALALATFLALTGRQGAASDWMKPGLRDVVRAAEKYLAKRPDLLQPLMASV